MRLIIELKSDFSSLPKEKHLVFRTRIQNPLRRRCVMPDLAVCALIHFALEKCRRETCGVLSDDERVRTARIDLMNVSRCLSEH